MGCMITDARYQMPDAGLTPYLFTLTLSQRNIRSKSLCCMKMYILYLLIISFYSCELENARLDGSYPKGFVENDLITISNCALEPCSDERIVRLLATNVKGKISQDTSNSEFVISYRYTFDSVINFYLCDLPTEFREVGLEVIYDGKALDACGIREALFPVEEIYTLKITKIKKL